MQFLCYAIYYVVICLKLAAVETSRFTFGINQCLDILYDSFMLFLCSLRERSQVEQLLRYIVEEAPEDAEKRRTFKYVSLEKTRFAPSILLYT